jgi:hypothetical protein
MGDQYEAPGADPRQAGRTHPVGAGPMTTAVHASQIEAAQLAKSSITARVEALERYAAEVAVADAAGYSRISLVREIMVR